MDHSLPHRDVRYVVCRLGEPGEPEGEREEIGRHNELGLAINHANRIGPGLSVDAEVGVWHHRGPGARRSRWHVEWINRNVYQAGATL